MSRFSKFMEIEIILSIFSNCNTIRLEINYSKKNFPKHKHVGAKQYVTKQPMGHWRNQRRNLKIPVDKWKWKHNDPKSMGFSKSNSKRAIYSDKSLPQETRKISNKESYCIPKRTRKRRTNKTQR